MKAEYRLAAMAACVLLAACGGDGGGGVNSTPAPPTGGTPAPTPTPPPPPPTPPPPPPPPNTSLANLQYSESFSNDASTSSASYSKNGSPGTASAAQGSLTISYDASTGSYTVTTAGRSALFTPANLDPATSTDSIAVYVTKSGNTTDSLTLTKPGSSGRLRYTYVAGGVWQRTTETAASISATFDSFAYGVASPASGLPKTGTATFDVDLLGAVGRSDTATSLGGTGSVTVDFLSGTLKGIGQAQEVRLDNNLPSVSGDWSLTAQIASTNNFSGTFTLYPSGGQIPGSVAGRFYGPQAQEIGAAWNVTSPNASGAGLLVGRIRPSTDSHLNASLLDLTRDETFVSTSKDLLYKASKATGAWVGTEEPQERTSQLSLAFNAADKSYAVKADASVVSAFGAANAVAAESNNRYDVYRKSTATGSEELVLYKPGTGNDELALTYASFARWTSTAPAFADTASNSVRTGYIAYGTATPGASVPRTGTASYSGVIHGTGLTGVDSMPRLDIGGTAVFDFNFAASSFTGRMNATGVDPATGKSYDLGRYDFVNGMVQSPGNGFGGQLSRNGQWINSYLLGTFMGPKAEELGATFAGVFLPPGTSAYGGRWVGAIVAKR